ncbi:hypothetical protein LguiA_023958 [Lonicera macranthoides]
MRMQGEMRRKFGGGRASGSDGYDFNYRMAVDSDSEAITASNGFRGNIKNLKLLEEMVFNTVSEVSEDLSGWEMNKSLLFKTAGVLVGEVHAILPD